MPFLGTTKRAGGARQVWLAVVTVALLAAVSGAYFAYAELKDRRRVERLAEVYRVLTQRLQGSEVAPVSEVLHEILALSPDNAEAVRRLADLTAGHATGGDTELAALLLRDHLRRRELDQAAVEAEAVVAAVPTHWEARAVLAERALRQGDRATAARHVKSLPAPNPSVPLYALLAVTRLAEKLGDADRLGEMRDFLTAHALPALRSSGAALESIGARLCLLESWHAAWPTLSIRPQLAGYWESAQKLCSSIQNEPGVGTDSLVALGVLQEAHLDMLADIRRQKLIPAAEAETAQRQVEASLEAIWGAVLKQDDRAPAAYVGLAMHLCRSEDFMGASEILERGRNACGDRPELLFKTAEVTAATDPARAVDFLDSKADPATADEDLLRIWAQSALRVDRAGRALMLCREAARRVPSTGWARLWEADACLRLDRPAEAVAALEFLRPLTTDDLAVAQLYSLALARSGGLDLAQHYFADLLDRSEAADVAVAAVRGLILAGQPALAVRCARRGVDRHPDHFNTIAAWADALRELASRDGTTWDRDLAQQAVDAYRRAGRLRTDDLAVANQIVRLELKALRRPQDAKRSAEPLAAAESRLPPEYLESLAMVRLESGQFAEARGLLERAVAARPGRASLHLNLARAYHGLAMAKEAQQSVARAAELPRTPGESAEMEEVKRLIKKE